MGGPLPRQGDHSTRSSKTEACPRLPLSTWHPCRTPCGWPSSRTITQNNRSMSKHTAEETGRRSTRNQIPGDVHSIPLDYSSRLSEAVFGLLCWHCWLVTHPSLGNPLDCSPPGSSVHGTLQGQNAGVGGHFPPPGDLPDPGIEPASPALQAGS